MLLYSAFRLYSLQSCDVELEEEVRSIGQAAPYIAITGEAGSENAQYFTCCELAQ